MFRLRIHFPSGESLVYREISTSELVDNKNNIGYIDKKATVLFSKAVIAGYVIVKEEKHNGT